LAERRQKDLQTVPCRIELGGGGPSVVGHPGIASIHPFEHQEQPFRGFCVKLFACLVEGYQDPIRQAPSFRRKVTVHLGTRVQTPSSSPFCM
jgi:hypothetical protein